ncbi:MAG: hypothetical protein ACYTEQ_09305 [Planctomycetota bacterium]|jgi:hypothetical protein
MSQADAEYREQALNALLGSKISGLNTANAGLVRKAKGVHEYDGLPYEGKVLNFKEDDPPDRKPQLRMRAHVKVFDMSDEEDRKQYEGVWQGVAEGRIMCSCEEKKYDKDISNWRIFLRWAEQYYTAPAGIREDLANAAENSKR